MQKLILGARNLGLDLTPKQLAAFDLYRHDLQAWNQRMNLTAIDDTEGILVRHFLDSLSCVLGFRQSEAGRSVAGTRLIDIGAGAGFPGLPLKIVCPSIQLTLVEATAKKVRFLEHLREQLALDGITIINGRAEELGQDPAHREGYDWAVARAVAEMPVLAELTLPFARIGGLVVAMKAATAEAEAAAAGHAMALLGGELAKIIPLQLPGLAEERRLVVVRKTACTPAAYPRRAGMPAKRPLK